MKIKALRAMLARAEEMYRTAGSDRAAGALREFGDALVVHDAKTVAAFVKLAAKVRS